MLLKIATNITYSCIRDFGEPELKSLKLTTIVNVYKYAGVIRCNAVIFKK
jgi:hypothetical protein